MCGIVGWVTNKKQVDKAVFSAMLSTLNHRGPDDGDVFYSNENKIAFGHRRLSFIDLSDAGRQPFHSSDGSVTITFNGEIYNYLELKEQLNEYYPFQTNTDTEVIAAAYLFWGISFIDHLKGMFAIGLHDRKLNKLFLIRDRFGIKPLYYLNTETDIVFASELKAIIQSGISKKEMDVTSFIDYFVYRYIPSPKTIWSDIKKVPPAHYVSFCLATFQTERIEYWTLKSSDLTLKTTDIIKQTNHLLIESVKEHTRSDVAIGAFLSGGYDSSALVAQLKENGESPETFSIGFKNWSNSEDQFATIVSEHLSVQNTAIIADESDLSLLSLMPTVYDEPIADISIIPTFMVSQLARTKVKAVLSGEGADEIFAGYTWQKEFYELSYPTTFLGRLKKIARPPMDTVSFYAQAMAMGRFDQDELRKMLHPSLHQFIPADENWFYRKHFKKDLSPLKAIQYLDMKCFMGELVLTKVDRASMANSLEVRVPFLDHTLFESVFALKEQAYFSRKQTKKLLYEHIKHKLPALILQRKKQGFVGPDAYYMKLEFYRKQFAKSNLVAHNIVNREYIDDLLKEQYSWKLWKLLVMENWFTNWVVNTH